MMFGSVTTGMCHCVTAGKRQYLFTSQVSRYCLFSFTTSFLRYRHYYQIDLHKPGISLGGWRVPRRS